MWSQVLQRRPYWVRLEGSVYIQHECDTQQHSRATTHDSMVRNLCGNVWVPPWANVLAVASVWFRWDVYIREDLLHYMCAQNGLSERKLRAVLHWLEHRQLATRAWLTDPDKTATPPLEEI